MPRWCASLYLRFCLFSCFLLLGGCQSAYFSAMEKVGYHKRDILVSRVNDARDEQERTAKQIRSTLENFRTVVNFSGGDLERQYSLLQLDLERSEKRALAVRERITAVQDVADALFVEWEAELGHYSNPALASSSQAQLRETRVRYERYLAAMLRAESRLEPVLRPFRDQVLFLKHNLNARAVASLQSEVVAVQADVEVLIREMEHSMRAADQFLQGLQQY